MWIHSVLTATLYGRWCSVYFTDDDIGVQRKVTCLRLSTQMLSSVAPKHCSQEEAHPGSAPCSVSSPSPRSGNRGLLWLKINWCILRIGFQRAHQTGLLSISLGSWWLLAGKSSVLFVRGWRRAWKRHAELPGRPGRNIRDRPRRAPTLALPSLSALGLVESTLSSQDPDPTFPLPKAPACLLPLNLPFWVLLHPIC